MKTKKSKSAKKITKNKINFSKLSPERKRVAIAKDVLQQIKLGRYIASAGSYIQALMMKDGKERWEMAGEDIKRNFTKIKSCEVCAMGACLMSITKFENKLKFSDVGASMEQLHNEKNIELFSSIFSPEQLLLIEMAFEGDSGGTRVGVDLFGLSRNDFKKKIAKCGKFYQKFDLSDKKSSKMSNKEINEYREIAEEKRLTAIMKNIIKNKGTFKP